MFEAAELGRTLSKEAYGAAVPDLRAELLEAQRRLRDTDTAVIVIVEGVDGVGRGEVVNRLNAWLDTRGVETHAFWEATSDQQARPRLWRYWQAMPARGGIGIFFGAWYSEPIRRHIRDEWDEARLHESLSRIRDFESMLVADGALIVKFWFHLPRDEQKTRLKQRLKDPASRWYRLPKGKEQATQYRRLVETGERVIRETDSGLAPWYLIEATDRRYRDLTVGRTLLDAIRERLELSSSPALSVTPSHAPSLPPEDSARITVLDHLDLTRTLEKTAYKERLSRAQARLRDLTWRAKDQGVATVLVFEGWDAAGKGGAIRRLTSGIDARLYRVVAVAAPTDEERAHHYLWRFWRHVPPKGRMKVFDRSWYGRVLVERVEGFAAEDRWRRAYHEINDFEEQLTEHGIVLVKFWLHISEEEQLARFKEREEVAYKQHKITDEDWRNRQQWEAYKGAVNEMVIRTSTEFAPWTLVPANDKRYGRVTVLETVCRRLEAALRQQESE
ncbi:polyphosphate:AMP phosphotransferase [Ectothiorhodospira lacustris]|uniref:polyphosphate:AMP phosphotransferase n=1 Tax=Ectothiorhodospira lacustris TaxID=2899127 RepID=UPI001EE7C16F|nr:polyphosphate:AMP phosphotransferase [Ectothiorhodospira lacustris]MCG5500687.1 polyphosphate:AMP phosphotransferase [Ectothiorhodospira lacustris]MCG5509927.1 polyphosphate:AMP phosphotransferase [Ectothiorhodospira lacustris]MCG5521181.1 polyphosphate:AMP phosphotransferase [Ectothiorhodospira lacustris]